MSKAVLKRVRGDVPRVNTKTITFSSSRSFRDVWVEIQEGAAFVYHHNGQLLYVGDGFEMTTKHTTEVEVQAAAEEWAEERISAPERKDEYYW